MGPLDIKHPELLRIASKHARKHEARVIKEFRVDSNDSGFICYGVSNVGGYKRNA